MKRNRPSNRSFLALILLLALEPAAAQTLISDPFTDASRTDATGGDLLGGVWWQNAVAPAAVTFEDDPAGIGSGLALKLSPTQDFHKLLTFFKAISLNMAGETLRVTFDYRFPIAQISQNDAFRIGLLNSNATQQTSDTGGMTRSDDKNYGFNSNPGLDGNGTGLRHEGAGDDSLGGSGAGARISFGAAGASASGTGSHSALLQITRLDNGDLAVQARIDSLTRATGIHPAASVLTYTFDQFALGFGGTGNRPVILLDNVIVDTMTQNVINIAATDSAASEVGLDPMTFTLTRSLTSGALGVPFTMSGTATAGSDYGPVSAMVNFADGQPITTLTIVPLEDWFIEGNETVTVALTQPPGSVLQTSTATATIADDGTRTIPSDALFFSKFDLARPGLEAVKAACLASDYATARSALAAYFRTRTSPVFPISTFTPDATRIANALQHKYTQVGVTYDFEPEPVATIDWSFNPTNPVNPEWTWQLNRHEVWDDLAQKYISNPSANSAYLNEFLFELNDWITTSPAPNNSGNVLGSRWRTIETGIRLLEVWPGCFYRLKSVPALTDDLLILWLKSFYMHGWHLNKYTAGSGNWVAIEQRGLFNVSALFPEFREAAVWRTLAIARLENLLTNDVLPDGAEVEFSPGYHDNVISDIEGVKSLAAANSLPTSTLFDAKLEALYAYEMWAVEPNGSIPVINDSWNLNVKSRMARGYTSFPHRTDFRWVSTGGTAGTMPAHTSHLFADAGQIVMRSGWSSTDNYLLMDAGPFGTAHQHEDKLSINVDGYGTRHIIDGGTYDYDTSNYRKMCLGSHSNSQPLVDDLDQNRLADSTLRRNPTPITWRTSSLFDYSAASYGEDSREGWGPARVRPAVTRRHVFFMKPDVWVVIDAFKALDSNSHTYSGIFLCNDENVAQDPVTRRVTVQLLPGEFDPYSRVTVTAAKPSLTITPLLDNGQTLQVIKGQETPAIFGYHFDYTTSFKKQPIPAVRFDRSLAGDTQMSYVLAAARGPDAPRTPTVTQAVTAPGTYGVTVSFGAPGDGRTFLIGLDGANTTWNGITHASPSLVVTASGVYAWDDTPAFDAWRYQKFGSANPASAPEGDADRDGSSNLLEFGLNGNPNDSSDSGLIASRIADSSPPPGDDLSLTIAVRDGAVFTGGTATVDGITYTVEGSDGLDFPSSAISSSGPSDTAPAGTDLPALTGTAWEYRTFKLNSSEGLTEKGFLRVRITSP